MLAKPFETALKVSIHAPARGATRRSQRTRTSWRGFNSRAREGRDKSRQPKGDKNHVSIHAPARGATLRGYIDYERLGVSIHAPARGATLPSHYGTPCRRACFNSRAREGRDGLLGQTLAQEVIVSIHAPARGATARASQYSPRGGVSIHAPARGATSPKKRKEGDSGCFNSRAREGRDALMSFPSM